MSFNCINSGCMCDGCMDCMSEPVMFCACCNDGIYDGEKIFEIDGETIHFNCISLYFENYLTYAEDKPLL